VTCDCVLAGSSCAQTVKR